MRSLSIYALIGGFFGLWITTILMAIAVPAYVNYLMPWGMYHDLPGTGVFLQTLGRLEGWLAWIGLGLYVWLWYKVAGRLNPALGRLPFVREGKPLWAWAAWLFAGALFLGAILLGLPIADSGLYLFGRSTNVVTWIVVLLSAAGAWALVSPQALGRFGGDYPSSLSWAASARSAMLGAFFILVSFLFLKAISAVFMIWFNVVVEVLDRSGEPSTFGWVWLLIGMVVLFAVGFAVVLGLLPVFTPGAGDRRARLTASRPALMLLAGALVVAAVSTPLVASTHLFGSKKLADVAGLSGIPSLSLRHIPLCLDRQCRATRDPSLKLGKPIGHVSTYGMLYSGGDVPLNPDTVPALEKFVTAHRYSVLRKSAMMGAAEVHKYLWQPLQAFRSVDRFVARGQLKHGSLLWTQIELAWLVNGAPINAGNRARLEVLSDEKRYFIGHRAAVRLAGAWARFGDMKRAQEFLARAVKAEPGKYDHVKLVRADLASGRVSGRLVMPGGTDGIRVGLFRVTEDPTARPAPKKDSKSRSKPASRKPKVPGPWSISRLSHSVVLSGDGRFSFGDLGSGEYYLALLVPGEKLKGKDKVMGSNVPDLILLNAASPRRDVGVIRLTPQ